MYRLNVVFMESFNFANSMPESFLHKIQNLTLPTYTYIYKYIKKQAVYSFGL